MWNKDFLLLKTYNFNPNEIMKYDCDNEIFDNIILPYVTGKKIDIDMVSIQNLPIIDDRSKFFGCPSIYDKEFIDIFDQLIDKFKNIINNISVFIPTSFSGFYRYRKLLR